MFRTLIFFFFLNEKLKNDQVFKDFVIKYGFRISDMFYISLQAMPTFSRSPRSRISRSQMSTNIAHSDWLKGTGCSLDWPCVLVLILALRFKSDSEGHFRVSIVVATILRVHSKVRTTGHLKGAFGMKEFEGYGHLTPMIPCAGLIVWKWHLLNWLGRVFGPLYPSSIWNQWCGQHCRGRGEIM